jgi:hypothetical protein
MQDFMGEALDCGLISLKFEGFFKNNRETYNLGRPSGRSDGQEQPATWSRWLASVWCMNRIEDIPLLVIFLFSPMLPPLRNNLVFIKLPARTHFNLIAIACACQPPSHAPTSGFHEKIEWEWMFSFLHFVEDSQPFHRNGRSRSFYPNASRRRRNKGTAFL